jgi:hypothetical protein
MIQKLTHGKVSYRNPAFISPFKCGGFPPDFLKIPSWRYFFQTTALTFYYSKKQPKGSRTFGRFFANFHNI